MKKINIVLLALAISIILPAIKAEASAIMDGSTVFANSNFNAVVYWQVWAPSDSLSPLGSISDYGYYYQIHNTGTDGDNAITQFGVDNPGKVTIDFASYLTSPNIDPLPGSLVAPSSISYGGDNSGLYSFTLPSIALGNDSYLLYFRTPYDPGMVNGGVQAGSYNTQARVPGPVPEPATTGLLGLGLVGFVGRVIRRKAKA